MTHAGPMPDSAGTFGRELPADVPCRECDAPPPAVTYREWESSCGGWVDYRYQCTACGRRWWIEGADS